MYKREAIRASLLCKPSEAIISFEKLIDWSKKNFTTIQVLSYTDKDHEKTKRFLNRRFAAAPPVPQILKKHCFIPTNKTEMLIKRYSQDCEKSIFSYEGFKK